MHLGHVLTVPFLSHSQIQQNVTAVTAAAAAATAAVVAAVVVAAAATLTTAFPLTGLPALPTTTAMALTFSTTTSRSARYVRSPFACAYLRPIAVLTRP